jgi:hypothetical protein
MKQGNFRTYKQRGEWVELLFMAESARRGFTVAKTCFSQRKRRARARICGMTGMM